MVTELRRATVLALVGCALLLLASLSALVPLVALATGDDRRAARQAVAEAAGQVLADPISEAQGLGFAVDQLPRLDRFVSELIATHPDIPAAALVSVDGAVIAEAGTWPETGLLGKAAFHEVSEPPARLAVSDESWWTALGQWGLGAAAIWATALCLVLVGAVPLAWWSLLLPAKRVEARLAHAVARDFRLSEAPSGRSGLAELDRALDDLGQRMRAGWTAMDVARGASAGARDPDRRARMDRVASMLAALFSFGTQSVTPPSMTRAETWGPLALLAAAGATLVTLTVGAWGPAGWSSTAVWVAPGILALVAMGTVAASALGHWRDRAGAVPLAAVGALTGLGGGLGLAWSDWLLAPLPSVGLIGLASGLLLYASWSGRWPITLRPLTPAPLVLGGVAATGGACAALSAMAVGGHGGFVVAASLVLAALATATDRAARAGPGDPRAPDAPAPSLSDPLWLAPIPDARRRLPPVLRAVLAPVAVAAIAPATLLLLAALAGPVIVTAGLLALVLGLWLGDRAEGSRWWARLPDWPARAPVTGAMAAPAVSVLLALTPSALPLGVVPSGVAAALGLLGLGIALGHAVRAWADTASVEADPASSSGTLLVSTVVPVTLLSAGLAYLALGPLLALLLIAAIGPLLDRAARAPSPAERAG